MHYDELRRALVTMPAAGDRGFEGLIAALLSLLTGDDFFVARSGEQPADAVSRGGVAIQAKRYDKTPLDETGFEGDFNKACRECHGLDVYVLAATRETAQLEGLSRKLEESHGVDIFLIGLADEQSPLTALCVTFWSTVRRYFPDDSIPAHLDVWAAAQAQCPGIVATVENLRRSLSHSVHTAENTRRRLDQHRASRFGVGTAASWSNRFPIDLKQFVVREQTLTALDAWWHQPSRRAAVLTAEEGMGKSWVAAAFAQRRVAQDEAIVLWLDSADWAGRTKLHDLVETGLKLAGVGDERVRPRLAGKALRQWRHRLLIVLDGINERNAKTTAHHLLAELFAPDQSPGRLLFTSRPIAWASDERSLWANTQPVSIDRFTEEELCEALQCLPTPVARAELPDGLSEIAKIPRYFRRALALRERFQSLANVSKEMVLWADLLEKIAANDPQVVNTLSWTSQADARRALLRLAEGASQLQHVDESEKGYQLLQLVFGAEYKSIRQDLAEQRIVSDPAGDQPQPSPAHIRLGFALHLGRFLQMRASQEVDTLADAIKRELEPLSSQDDVTEAIFVALQLSALTHGELPKLAKNARAALLLAWATSHNAHIEPARLLFWALEDEAAYLDFLEVLFFGPVSEFWMRDFLHPLSELWKQTPDPTSLFAQRLRNWLKYVWGGTFIQGSGLYTVGRHRFPIAKAAEQLALSKVALAVFSQTSPMDELLFDFVLAWGTEELCAEEHFTPEHEGQPAQRFLVRCKELERNLGAYFRWGYTEHIKSKLTVLRNDYAEDPLVSKACDEIIENFDVFGWRRVTSPELELRNGASLFRATPEGKRERFSDCAHLAVREDLPALSVEDKASVKEIMEQVFTAEDFHGGRRMTMTDLSAQHFLAWFARCHPERLLELGTRFRLTALTRAEEHGALGFANNMPYSPQFVPPRELLAASKAMALRIMSGVMQDRLWALKECHVLALTCFGEDELNDWFEFAAQHPTLRRELHCYPMPLLLPHLCTRQIANFALQRAVNLASVPIVPSKEPDSEFEFWADIASRSCDPDAIARQTIADLLETCPRGNWRRFHLLMIYFRSLSDEDLGRAFAAGDLLRHLDLEGWRALRSSGRDNVPWKALPRNFNLVLDSAGLNVAGSLFAEAGHTEELQRWGEMLFVKASQLLNETPPAREFWGRTIQYADAKKQVSGSRCDGTDGPPIKVQEPLRPERPAAGTAFPTDQEWDRRNASTNRAIRLWLEDVQRLEDLPSGILFQFQATHALGVFRNMNPERFRFLATLLLEQIRKTAAEAFHLGGFVHAVASVLMPLDPEYAMTLTRELREGPFRSDFVNEHGTSISEAAAWAAAQAGNKPCVDLCLAILKNAGDDAQLVSHAITAQAEGAAGLLLSLCEFLLQSGLAKERCLAISLLPWLWEPNVVARLLDLARDDPSGWVRAHAEWAATVARQESATRACYERVLNQTDVATARALLEVMRPALTPTARWWRADLERKRLAQAPIQEDLHAAIALFWDGVTSTRKDSIELFGRKLGEYLRGEKISDLRFPGPWLT